MGGDVAEQLGVVLDPELVGDGQQDRVGEGDRGVGGELGGEAVRLARVGLAEAGDAAVEEAGRIAAAGLAAAQGAVELIRFIPRCAVQPRSAVEASLDRVPAVNAADAEKRAAAAAAALLVEDGMRVGLGTGSTVALLLPALAARGLREIRCVATSVATERQARELRIPVEAFDSLAELDIAIDGTDQVTPEGWLIKGGGGAHLREKVVAAAAARFVVIGDSSKPVESLRGPLPLELFGFGAASTLARLGDEVEPRGVPASPDGGLIADYRGPGLDDPAALAARLEADPGVAAHGLFPPALVADVLIARGESVEHRQLSD